MRVEHLRYFAVAVELGSFNKAAKFFNTSHQTISAGISTVEKDFGAQLINRDSYGITLTNVGEQVYPLISVMLDNYTKAKEIARDAGGVGPDGGIEKDDMKIQLTIYFSHFLNSLINATYSRFTNKHSETFAVFFEGDSGDVLKHVLSEKNSIAIMTHLQTIDENEYLDKVAVYPLPFTYRMYVVLARNHPLAGYKSLTKVKMAKYPICVFSSPDNKHIYSRFADLDEKPVFLNTNNVELYRDNILNRQAIGYLPKINNKPFVDIGGTDKIIYIPYKDAMSTNIVCCMRRDLDRAYRECYRDFILEFIDTVYETIG